MQKFPMTVEGEEALRSELQQLKTVDRPRVIAAIAEPVAPLPRKPSSERKRNFARRLPIGSLLH